MQIERPVPSMVGPVVKDVVIHTCSAGRGRGGGGG